MKLKKSSVFFICKENHVKKDLTISQELCFAKNRHITLFSHMLSIVVIWCF